MAAPPIKNWIVCISGYLQSRGTPGAGVPRIYHELFNRHPSPKVNVVFAEWKSDWAAYAEWMHRCSDTEEDGERPTVMIVAYSWGAGYGFTKLTEELAFHGIRVRCAVLSDAVCHLGPKWCHGFPFPIAQFWAYRPWFEKWFGGFTILPKPRIIVPETVDEVHWYLQTNSRLHGHELYRIQKHAGDQSVMNTAENRHDASSYGYNHTNMDDLPSFRTCAYLQAEKLFGAAA